MEEPGLQWTMAYFLPDRLAVSGTVEPEVRHRGIYDAVVYSTRLKFAGGFVPDFAAAGIEHDRIDWAQAKVLFGVTDLRGIRTVSAFAPAGGKVAAFEAAEATSASFLPLEAKLAELTPGARIDLTLGRNVPVMPQSQTAAAEGPADGAASSPGGTRLIFSVSPISPSKN